MQERQIQLKAAMLPARAPQPNTLNVTALLASILLVAPFLRALWQILQGADGAWLPANGDVLLFGAIIAAVLIGDSLRHGRPTRVFLLVLAASLAAIGLGSAVFAIGLQFDVRQARLLDSLTLSGPLLAFGCAYGARHCLKLAFADERAR